MGFSLESVKQLQVFRALASGRPGPRHDRFIRAEIKDRGGWCGAEHKALDVTDFNREGPTNIEVVHVCYLTPDHAKTSTLPDPEEHRCECGHRFTGNGHTAAFNRINDSMAG
jgi:hypothetical protein